MKNFLGDEIPDMLYRYMPWRLDKETGKNYAKELLLNKQIFLQSANNFNDPFDTALILKMTGSGKLLVKRYAFAYRNYNHKEASKQDKKNIRKTPLRDRIKVAERHMQVTRKLTGIYCLSKCNKNILLWSHYADNHTGICLAFNTKQNPFSLAVKVEYDNEYPKINYLRSDIVTIIRKKYLTKAMDWHYENEYRIVLSNYAGKRMFFLPESLKGIFCGCNMREDDILDLKETLKNSKLCVPVYQAEKEKSAYRLKFKSI